MRLPTLRSQFIFLTAEPSRLERNKFCSLNIVRNLLNRVQATHLKRHISKTTAQVDEILSHDLCAYWIITSRKWPVIPAIKTNSLLTTLATSAQHITIALLSSK